MDIESLLKNADNDFPLKQALLGGHRYYADFLNTMLVFKKNLTKKEYESVIKKFQFSKKYDMQKYMQIVSEINVLYYILRMYNNQFKYEPKYNNGYNPECSFEFGGKIINLEVKCPNMEKRIEEKQRGAVKIYTAERIPEHQTIINELTNIIETNIKSNGFSGVEEIHRMDNKLKDFLVSAQAKFPISKDSNFNILAISLDIISDLDEWYSYIFGNNGAFTNQSFIKEEYANVDAILLTTPVCGHIRWSCYDKINVWGLEETVNLLFLNPDREASETGRFYFEEGLNLFGSLTKEFLIFQEKLDIQESKKWNSLQNYSWQDRYFDFKNTDLKIISEFFEYLNSSGKLKEI